MQMNTTSLRIGTILVATAAMVIVSVAATAATRSMTGTILVENPSSGFELQPGVFGRKVGGVGPATYPPTDGTRMVEVAGATASTFVGRPVTLAAGLFDRTGVEFRDFPAFANVGQLTKAFQTLQQAATFSENNGALAECPGPGCTSSGAGTAISWCPPNTHVPAAPAPGTVGAQIGNWDCPSWQAGVGGGDRFLRIGISNASGRPNFGGTLNLLRNHMMNVWRVGVQPSTPNAGDAEVTRSFMDNANIPWSGGRTNFAYTPLPGNNGPRLLAQLNANGAIAATFGCTNGVGTNGGSFMQGSPIVNVGSNCGTDPGTNVDGQGWGFKMTTGTVSGSDPYPFGLVVTTVAGTPFNPAFTAQPASLGFFFSRQGTDAVSGTNRNLVLLGGGVSVDPDSGNAFFRITNLSMNMTVPEPATSLGLLAGAGLLVGVARRRFGRSA